MSDDVMKSADDARPQPEPQREADAPEPQWAIVEVFGHRRHAGRISEVEQFGAKMMRIDIPGEGDAIKATHFYGGASIFSLSYCTEEVARKLNEPFRPAARYSLPAPEEEHEEDLFS